VAEIVSAAATSHILMSRAGAETAADRVFEGMLRIGRHVRASKPDVLVVISSDHMFNVAPGTAAPFLVGCGDSFVPFGDMDIPRETYRGKPDFASGLVGFAWKCGINVQRLESLRPDHGTAIPLLFANPDRDIPVVPVLVNYDRDPPPSPAEGRQLGSTIREFIALERPAGERVALVAAGGLSHWVGFEGPTINEGFDRRFLESMRGGQLDEWNASPAADIRRGGGNGGLEVISWLTMAAAVPRSRAEVIYYEPMPSWLTGMGGVVMTEDPKRTSRSPS
jgi:2'-aminobiphenyl-2,3-diol 1,2-dioxygenase, large subunit